MQSLRKLKNMVLKNMSMKDFFTSDIFKPHLYGIIKMVSSRYNDEAMFVLTAWGGKDIAYTNNREVFINLNNEIIQNLTDLEERYLCCLGFLGHELGHVLYTDFEFSSKACFGEYSDVGLKGSDLRVMSEIQKARDAGYNKFISKIYKNVNNILEDGFVNDRISRQFPGTFKSGIQKSLDLMFKDGISVADYELNNVISVLHCLAVGHPVPAKLLQSISCYDELAEIVQDNIQKELPFDRIALSNRTMVCLWPLIKPLINQAADQESPGENGNERQAGNNQSQAGGSDSGNENSKVCQDVLSKLKESSQIGEGKGILNQQRKKSNSKEQNDTNTKEKSAALDNKECNNVSDAGTGKKNLDSKNDSQDQSEGQSQGQSEGQSAADKMSNENIKDKCSNTKGEKFSDTEGNCSKPADTQSNRSENSHDAYLERGNKEISESDSCEIDIEEGHNVLEKLLSRYAREYILKNPEKTELQSLNEIAENIKEGSNSPHQGYPFKIRNVKSDSTDKKLYDAAFTRLSGISRRLQKRVEAILSEKNDGGVCKNLLKGNKINPAAAACSNGKIFKRNVLPDSQDLVVSVLIDQSGSMSGARIEKALEMAIVIESFCSGLNIPLAITGHMDGMNGVNLTNFIRFEDNSKSRKYNLAQLKSGGCNRDGFALKYCVDNLMLRPEENKLMILISDGRPNSNKYSGKLAEQDLMEIKKTFERKGGRLIAAAIGDDKEIISRIYGNSFLDISDLEKLPMKMVSIISKYLQS